MKLVTSRLARIGTNPEQLFAAGWSTCFESAIGIAGQRRKIAVPEITIEAEVDLRVADGEHVLSARFNISLAKLCVINQETVSK